jgi:predicted dehydrogenase
MPESGLSIYGTNGFIKVNDDQVVLELKDGTSHKWYRHDLVDNVNFLIGAPEYFREDEAFVKAIRCNCTVKPDFAEASKVDYVIEKVKQKAKYK